MLSLEAPTLQAHEAFSNVFNNVNNHLPYPTLGGCSTELYNDRNDLMVLRRQPEEDRLTRFLRHYLTVLFVVSSSK
jgi:hypothetical protein